MADLPYRIVIGLEVHVQLLTRTKLFCGCSTQFGLPPNSATCPVCTGMPGVLPVLNRQAFDLSLRAAMALNCEIARFTKWDRKNYYYPDLPKNYQISQYDLPLGKEGWLEITCGGTTRKIGIIRAHLDEDAGKLLHDEHGTGQDSLVDLNRTGTPLLEIVSKPELTSAEEARLYLEEMRLLMRELGVSDCEMQEGSLRCDANVNLHIPQPDGGGHLATPIVEIKNLNSFRAVEKALVYEVGRQYQKWLEDGKTIQDAPKTTRGWSDVEEVTKPQREKETAADYRYFPEPDLVPVVVDASWLDRIRRSIGELPAARRRRFETEYGLSAYDANVLVEQGQDVADYYDAVARATGAFKLASNWIQQDVLRTIKEKKLSLAEFPIRPERLADLINRVQRQELNTNQGREILGRMIDTGDPAEAIIAQGGYQMLSDRETIAAAVAAAIAANPQALEELKKGKKKPEAVKGFLRGQVMKQTGGKANPALVGELLEAQLGALQVGSG
jgi:aspartyl-tRNA(Asn)/glutamyl-tRNA(Gln) amidotransferase subunit B